MGKIDNEKKFVDLVSKYQNLVFSICLKMTGDYFSSEDIVQETFLTVYKNIDKYDNENEKAWICKIAGNKCIDYKRSKQQQLAQMTDNLEESCIQDDDDPLELFVQSEVLEELKKCCDRLEEPYKSVAGAYFIQGKTSNEIAEQRKYPIKTVQTQIRRAREKLKSSFGREMLLR